MDKDNLAVESSPGVALLSTETLIQIFDNLKHSDRLNASLVSKRWYSVVRMKEFNGLLKIRSMHDKKAFMKVFEDRVWPFHKLLIDGSIIGLKAGEWTLFWNRMAPIITEITFGAGRSSIDWPTFARVLPKLVRLQKLTFLGHSMKVPSSVLYPIRLESVTELDLCSVTVSESLLHFLIKCCPNLEILHVNSSTFGGQPADMVAILKKLHSVPTVKLHLLLVSGLDEKVVPELASINNVEFLGIDCCAKEPRSLPQNRRFPGNLELFSAKTNKIEQLVVDDDTFLGDEDLSAYLERLESIESIRFNDLVFDAYGFFSLLNRMPDMKSIHLIDKRDGRAAPTPMTRVVLTELERLIFVTDQDYDRGWYEAFRLYAPKLRVLRIPKMDLTLLNCFPLLEELEINHNHWISWNDSLILSSLPCLSKLTITNLRSTQGVAWTDIRFKALKLLKIEHEWLDFDVSAKQIADFLNMNSTIRDVRVKIKDSTLLKEDLMEAVDVSWKIYWKKEADYLILRLNKDDFYY